MNVQVAEEEEDRCDQAEDKKPPTEEVTDKDDEKIKTDKDDEKIKTDKDDEKIKTDKDDEKIKTDETVQECEEPSPPCEFSWYATQWSQCSSKCAGMMGLQTRLEDDEDDDVDGGGGGTSGCCNLSSNFLTGLCFAEPLMTTGL